MKLFQYFVIALAAILTTVCASAKIAVWTIKPDFDQITRLHGDIYAFEYNGKWGLVKPDNNILLPASCDYFTSFVNGYAVAGTKDGARYALKYIISEDGDVTEVSDGLFLPSSYKFFSEGKLAVMNRNRKFGYINSNGRLIIRCQFDDALPFKEGYAPVWKGDYAIFISPDYDYSNDKSKTILSVDFNYGEMTDATCFANGQAAVAYNNKYAVVSNYGNKVRSIKGAEFDRFVQNNNAAPKTSNGFNTSARYNVYSENGRYGIKSDGAIVVGPQLDKIDQQFDDNSFIAHNNGRTGLLKLIDGDFQSALTANGTQVSAIDIDRKGNIKPLTLDCKFPKSIEPKDVRILVDNGDGQLRDMTSSLELTQNGAKLSIAPQPLKNADNVTLRAQYEYGGFSYDGINQSIELNYPVRLRVSAPGPDTIRANENDNATFSSTIFNDSNKAVTVNATWSTGASQSVTIEPHSHKTISSSIKVTSTFTKEVSISISTGEYAKSEILFKPYF